LGGLVKQRGIEYIQGTASFSGSGTLDIRGADGNNLSLAFENCILATGSRPLIPPGIAIRSDRLWDSTAALELREIPRSLLVIGGGYIGVELGSVYAQLGSRVTLVEMLPGILPGADRDLVQTFLRRSGKRFAGILTESRVTGLEETADGLRATIENQGESVRKDFQYVLVSTGRRPNSDRIGLEKTAVRPDPRGFVQTGPDCGTGDPCIRAIGDVTGGAMLAHKASHEGRAAVDTIAGKAAVFAPRAIPAVVYTDPEIAFTGLTESEARKKGLDVRVLKFPWAASGRAQAAADPDGLTKLISDPGTGKILGVGIAGQNAGEMISEGSLAIGMDATAKDLASVIHPHPTLSETLMEAAEMFEGTCTHIFRPKRS
ncbi:MAG TPA: dihydrolipoyl dehydrogenase, partial [bacterium]|nr:dihydrolipoyl dehydrogenase [bacterium]